MDVQQLLVIKEEILPGFSPSLEQQDQKPLHIKEEEEELWTSQEGEHLHGLEEEEEAAFHMKSEDDDEKPQFLHLHQSQTEVISETEPPTSCSDKRIKTVGTFSRDSPNIRPPKIFSRKWPKSAFVAFMAETTRPTQDVMMMQGKNASSTGIPGRANMSAVWTYFIVSENDPRIAICKTCYAEVSRGGACAKSFSTSGLIYHLKSRHPDHYAKYVRNAAQKRKIPPSMPTPPVVDVSEKTRKFPSDGAKAKGITRKIMEFIALDDQPFSVVEDVGFRRLLEHIEPRYAMPSTRHLSDVCLPELFNVVAAHVHELLAADVSAISFTTDVWSSDVGLTSVLRLTAQWIDADFQRQKILLHSQEFEGSHTAAAISDAFTDMFDAWHIDRAKVHAVVSDNARNMAKAIEESQLKGIRCMAHTLHLAVNEGVLSQSGVKHVLDIGRRIVGHFNHSQLAYSRLQSMQDQFGAPIERFQLDVSTRWNSTYHMLESLFAQKQVLAAYGSDHELPATFTSHQWLLIENVLSLLAPFEQLTKEISSSDASVADVIPLIAALKRLLSKEVDTDHGVKTMKSTLLESVGTRFADICSHPLYFIATVLDPRYKDHYLDVGVKQRAREMIQAAMDAENLLGDGDGEQSAEKMTCLSAPDEGHAPLLSDMFSEILQESASYNNRMTTSSTVQQLNGYLSEVPIPRSDNPLTYWRNSQGRFPDLAKIARKYLSAPCTSTDGEEGAFSAAAEKRNGLNCDEAEKLLFIKKNLPLYLNKYNGLV